MKVIRHPSKSPRTLVLIIPQGPSSPTALRIKNIQYLNLWPKKRNRPVHIKVILSCHQSNILERLAAVLQCQLQGRSRYVLLLFWPVQRLTFTHVGLFAYFFIFASFFQNVLWHCILLIAYDNRIIGTQKKALLKMRQNSFTCLSKGCKCLILEDK